MPVYLRLEQPAATVAPCRLDANIQVILWPWCQFAPVADGAVWQVGVIFSTASGASLFVNLA